jgi:spermidine synthase
MKDREGWLLGLISLIYFATGFCALLYQIIWIYMFGLVFGSTFFATSTVIAVFFSGIALGSHFFGRRSIRLTRPIRLYGLLELGIGSYALAFPTFLRWAEKAYAEFYPAMGGHIAATTLVRMMLSFGVLLLPTFLMGGTLPVLLRHFGSILERLGRRAGLIYGLNALGAAAGSLIAGYVLLRYLGMSGANLLAGMLNGLVGAVAFLAGGVPSTLPVMEPESDAPSPVEPGGIALPSATIRWVFVCFACSGFVSLSYEMLWIRYLLLFFRDTIYLYTGIIACFVLGIGLGGLLGGFWSDRIRRPVTWLGMFQSAIGLTTVAAVYIPLALGPRFAVFGEQHPGHLLGVLLGLLGIPAFLMGAGFPLVARVVTRAPGTSGDRMGRAYAWNTVGSILGTLVTGFLLVPWLGLQPALLLMFGLNTILALLLLRAEPARTWKPIRMLPAMVFLPVVLMVCARPDFAIPAAVLRQYVSAGDAILDVREGFTGTTWTTRSREGETQLIENTVVIGRNRGGNFVSQGFIPLLISRRLPQSVLGLAFGAGLFSYGDRLLPEVRRLDFVDISAINIASALDHFPENKGMRQDPRVRFIVDDALNFVKHCPGAYDLIQLEPTPPMYGYHAATLYTLEFYRCAKTHLADGGLFCQILPLGNMTRQETLGTMRTFASAFDDCLLWYNGNDCVMIGSNREIQLDLAEIDRRLRRSPIQAALRQYSSAHFDEFSNFLAGLLLTTDDFRRMSSGGVVYTEDSPGLAFSTGRGKNPGGAGEIHRHLTPWEVIANERMRPFVLRNAQILINKREYFMTFLYPKPEFYNRFLQYIQRFSTDRRRDCRQLRRILSRDGETARARALEPQLRRLEED